MTTCLTLSQYISLDVPQRYFCIQECLKIHVSRCEKSFCNDFCLKQPLPNPLVKWSDWGLTFFCCFLCVPNFVLSPPRLMFPLVLQALQTSGNEYTNNLDNNNHRSACVLTFFEPLLNASLCILDFIFQSTCPQISTHLKKKGKQAHSTRVTEVSAPNVGLGPTLGRHYSDIGRG